MAGLSVGVEAPEYYKILGGVTIRSTADEIKKAYRQAALKSHPDKNPGNEEVAAKKFKEIAEAYEILGNEEKRAMYDELGPEAYDAFRKKKMPPGTKFVQIDAREIFRKFFGENFDIFGEGAGGVEAAEGPGGVTFSVVQQEGSLVAPVNPTYDMCPFLEEKFLHIPNVIECSKEELYQGAWKQIERTIQHDPDDPEDVEVVKERVRIDRGMKAMDRIQHLSSHDHTTILYTIQEKAHPRFFRTWQKDYEKNCVYDLFHRAECVGWYTWIFGGVVKVKTLEKYDWLTSDDGSAPDLEITVDPFTFNVWTTIAGWGMPKHRGAKRQPPCPPRKTAYELYLEEKERRDSGDNTRVEGRSMYHQTTAARRADTNRVRRADPDGSGTSLGNRDEWRAGGVAFDEDNKVRNELMKSEYGDLWIECYPCRYEVYDVITTVMQSIFYCLCLWIVYAYICPYFDIGSYAKDHTGMKFFEFPNYNMSSPEMAEILEMEAEWNATDEADALEAELLALEGNVANETSDSWFDWSSWTKPNKKYERSLEVQAKLREKMTWTQVFMSDILPFVIMFGVLPFFMEYWWKDEEEVAEEQRAEMLKNQQGIAPLQDNGTEEIEDGSDKKEQ